MAGSSEYAGYGRRTSVTAGTIFDRTRTPLTVWFTACWLFATQKDGVSAQSLQRALDIGSYQTAWAMLGRLRSVLVRPGRDLLAGAVEVDETFIGGEEPGLRGGRARGKKSLVGIAVEVREPKGIGRCRMAILPDASAAALRPFITGHIERAPASSPTRGRATTGWTPSATRTNGAASAPPAPRGEDPGELLPAVHRIASLAKRWLLGTHQGSVDPARLASYLNEFVFRFNRRRSASRGLVFCRLLQLAAAHDPVRYRDLVASQLRLRAPSAPTAVPRTPAQPGTAACRPSQSWSTPGPGLLRLNGYPRRGLMPSSA